MSTGRKSACAGDGWARFLRKGYSGCLLGVTDAMVEQDGTYFWMPPGVTIRWHSCRLYEPIEIVGQTSGTGADPGPKVFTITLAATATVNT